MTTARPASSRPIAQAATPRPGVDWRHQAACRDEDPELFFPVGTTGPAELQIRQAKSVCHQRCPVMTECLQWALAAGQDFGVWGGMSEDERRALKRRRQREDLISREGVDPEHRYVQILRKQRGEYLTLVAAGRTLPQIAKELHASHATIRKVQEAIDAERAGAVKAVVEA